MTPADLPPTFLRSDKKYRILMVALLLGLLLLGAVLILFTNSYIDELHGVAQQSSEKSLRDTGLLLLGMTMLAGLPAVGIGTYVAYLGYRIRVTGQSPSPGTRVAIDTHVIKGISAKVRGAMLIVLGSLVILFGLGLPIVVWRLSQTF